MISAALRTYHEVARIWDNIDMANFRRLGETATYSYLETFNPSTYHFCG